MAYQVVSYAESPITHEVVFSILCDTVADLPSTTITCSWQSGPVVQGCSATIIENGAKYVANSAGTWILQPSQNAFSNVYTKTETDGRLSAHVCTCDTAGNVADKVATTSDDFVLREGSIIAVKFTYTNTVSDNSSHPITINVNNTGAYRVYYQTGELEGTTQTGVFGAKDFYIYYVFHDDRWVWMSFSRIYFPTLMTQAEATAGTSTNVRSINAKVLHDTIIEQTNPLKSSLTDIINSSSKNKLQLTGSDVTGYGIACTFDKINGTIHLDGINSDKKCTGSFNIQASDSRILGLVDGETYNFSCGGYETNNDTIGLYVYTSGATPISQFDCFTNNVAAWNPAWEQASGFRLFIRQGTVVDNVTLKPMICTQKDYTISNTFEPYTPTLHELYALIKSYHP